MLQAIIGLVLIGTVATAILPNSLRIWQDSVADRVYAELTVVRATIDNCYVATNNLADCDTKAKLRIVSDGTLQPYAVLSITTTTAVVVETFASTGRGNLCNTVSGVSGTITDTPTGVSWSRVFSGVLAACQR